jgi:hypothetical protein
MGETERLVNPRKAVKNGLEEISQDEARHIVAYASKFRGELVG